MNSPVASKQARQAKQSRIVLKYNKVVVYACRRSHMAVHFGLFCSNQPHQCSLPPPPLLLLHQPNKRQDQKKRTVMYSHTPPAPPPKPGNHDTSGMSTPVLVGPSSHTPRPPPPLPEAVTAGGLHSADVGAAASNGALVQAQDIPDPGDQWLPKFLQDKSYVYVWRWPHTTSLARCC